MRIFHLASVPTWEEALGTGAYRGSTLNADLSEVGYVHASSPEAQLLGVVATLYRSEPLEAYVVLAIDPQGCEAAGSQVCWEVPEDSTEAYPHVYGPVPLDAVEATAPIARGKDGSVTIGSWTADHRTIKGPDPQPPRRQPPSPAQQHGL